MCDAGGPGGGFGDFGPSPSPPGGGKGATPDQDPGGPLSSLGSEISSFFDAFNSFTPELGPANSPPTSLTYGVPAPAPPDRSVSVSPLGSINSFDLPELDPSHVGNQNPFDLTSEIGIRDIPGTGVGSEAAIASAINQAQIEAERAGRIAATNAELEGFLMANEPITPQPQPAPPDSGATSFSDEGFNPGMSRGQVALAAVGLDPNSSHTQAAVDAAFGVDATNSKGVDTSGTSNHAAASHAAGNTMDFSSLGTAGQLMNLVQAFARSDQKHDPTQFEGMPGNLEGLSGGEDPFMSLFGPMNVGPNVFDDILDDILPNVFDPTDIDQFRRAIVDPEALKGEFQASQLEELLGLGNPFDTDAELLALLEPAFNEFVGGIDPEASLSQFESAFDLPNLQATTFDTERTRRRGIFGEQVAQARLPFNDFFDLIEGEGGGTVVPLSGSPRLPGARTPISHPLMPSFSHPISGEAVSAALAGGNPNTLQNQQNLVNAGITPRPPHHPGLVFPPDWAPASINPGLPPGDSVAHQFAALGPRKGGSISRPKVEGEETAPTTGPIFQPANLEGVTVHQLHQAILKQLPGGGGSLPVGIFNSDTSLGPKIIPEPTFTADDEIIQAILDERMKDPQRQISTAQARGNLNALGAFNANQALKDQRTAGQERLGTISNSILGLNQRDLDEIFGTAEQEARSFPLNSSVFDVSPFVSQAETLGAERTTQLESDIRTALGTETLFDPGAALSTGASAGGLVGGDSALGGSSPLLDAISQRRRSTRAKKRGLGTQGAF